MTTDWHDGEYDDCGRLVRDYGDGSQSALRADVLRQNNVLSQFERFRKLFGRATKRDDQLENNCHAMVVFDDVYALALIRRACPIRIRDLRRVALIRTGNVA